MQYCSLAFLFGFYFRLIPFYSNLIQFIIIFMQLFCLYIIMFVSSSRLFSSRCDATVHDITIISTIMATLYTRNQSAHSLLNSNCENDRLISFLEKSGKEKDLFVGISGGRNKCRKVKPLMPEIPVKAGIIIILSSYLQG